MDPNKHQIEAPQPTEMQPTRVDRILPPKKPSSPLPAFRRSDGPRGPPRAYG